jgi:hypothetical protein
VARVPAVCTAVRTRKRAEPGRARRSPAGRGPIKLVVAVVFAAGVGVLAVGRAEPATPGLGAVTSSRLLSPAAGQISVDDGFIAVTSGTGGSCTIKLLNPASLEVVASRAACPEVANDDLVVRPAGLSDGVHVMVAGPKTDKKTAGPLVLSIENWAWARSSVAEGDGAVWIYDRSSSVLLDVSEATGCVVHRFSAQAGDNPYLFVDYDGLWLTPSAWGGSSCASACTLWHVAPGSDRLVAVRELGGRTQWLMWSGHSIYADVLTGAAGRWRQTIWELDGPGATVVYQTPATLLPSAFFTLGTGYVVVGHAEQGYFTLAQLGRGKTPLGFGDCDRSAPVRVVRIDPATGQQSYIATIAPSLAGAQLDCHLVAHQGLFYHDAFYVVANDSGDLVADYQRVLRVQT